MLTRRSALILAALALMHPDISFPRPNDPADAPPDPGTGKPLVLAEVWGEQLRTPAQCARAIVNLREGLTKWANIAADVGGRKMLGTGGFPDMPVIFLMTGHAFQLTEAEMRNLGEYVRSGGLLFLDSLPAGQSRNQADASFRAMIREAFDSGGPRPIPDDHPIYHCWFDFDGPPAGAESDPQSTAAGNSTGETMSGVQRFNSSSPPGRPLEGVWVNGRLAVVLSDRGYAAKWSAESNNDPQLKLGVNCIVFAIMSRARENENR